MESGINVPCEVPGYLSHAVFKDLILSLQAGSSSEGDIGADVDVPRMTWCPGG